MKIINFLFTIVLSVLFIPHIYADTDLSVFETVYKVSIPELQKPTVVSAMLPSETRYGVAIIESDNNIPQPWISISQFEEKLKLTVKNTSFLIGNKNALTDRNYNTSAEFDLDKDNGKAFLELEGDKEFTTSTIQLSLDYNVALPHTIALFAFVNGSWKTIVAEKHLESTSVSFPETTAKNWRIEFNHAQPLRLREIAFTEKRKEALTGVEIRWLARQGKTYTLYTDAHTYSGVKTAESGKLQGEDLDVIKLKLGEGNNNPIFKESDIDKDGIPDVKDNCVTIANVDQKDIDFNGRGDACEDFDGDGVVNFKDNCLEYPNRNQSDVDADGIGDVCDKEESRFTEKNPWLPWTAMGIAALMVFLIVVQTVKKQN